MRHRFGGAAQHGRWVRSRAAARVLIAVQQNLNALPLRRVAFVLLLPPFQGLAHFGTQKQAINYHGAWAYLKKSTADTIRISQLLLVFSRN